MMEMMNIWDKVLKAGCAAFGAVAGFFGGWNAMLTMLAMAMVIDYISGVIVAALGKSHKTTGGGLDSKVGFVGLGKKAFILLIVLLATMLDRTIGTDKLVFQAATACYYIANEAISICENAGLMGIPIPPILQKAFEQLRKEGEEDPKDGTKE